MVTDLTTIPILLGLSEHMSLRAALKTPENNLSHTREGENDSSHISWQRHDCACCMRMITCFDAQ